MKITSRQAIHDGWSTDKKYYVTDELGQAYILRIADIEKLDKKRQEFQLMQKIADLAVPMCRPIKFGLCPEGVYTIHSWIDGSKAERFIPQLCPNKQYDYGLQAGRILRQIHSVGVGGQGEDWSLRFNRKIDKKIANYDACPIKFQKGDLFLDYIQANRYLLDARPQTFQHGDYHIGNMMVDRKGNLHIIDFDRSDFGDPWEEFNRIVWSVQGSAYFATGLVDGYFDNIVSDDFWKLLALYISNNMLSSLTWALPYGEDQIKIMLRQAEDVLTWYQDMRHLIPTWYQQP
ncbi:TPA: aminoglycoside phosphotransferase family protein [Streptococcus suis]